MPLIIGQTKINYLSGPNQMFYLQPLQNVSPLILFGDVHFSGKNQCEQKELEYSIRRPEWHCCPADAPR